MIRFLFICLSLLFVFGCADEHLSQPIETLFFQSSEVEVPIEGTLGPVPTDLSVLLWGDLDGLMQRLETMDRENPLWDFTINRICEIREQREYYQKYINAGGVVIMGDKFLDDRLFYATREIVLGMTSKRTDLREHLSPSHEERVNLTGKRNVPSRKFRMIIVSSTDRTAAALPAADAVPRALYNPGWCNLDLCVSSMKIYGVYSADGTHNEVLDTNVFVHEFAHALHYALNLIDATFENRLIGAYEDAKNNDNSYWGAYMGGANAAEGNYGEYWAYCSEKLFNLFVKSNSNRAANQHNRFRENDPLMYALLEDIYDFEALAQAKAFVDGLVD